jgi:hypothetical protein
MLVLREGGSRRNSGRPGRRRLPRRVAARANAEWPTISSIRIVNVGSTHGPPLCRRRPNPGTNSPFDEPIDRAQEIGRNVPLKRALIKQSSRFDLPMSHHDLHVLPLAALNQRRGAPRGPIGYNLWTCLSWRARAFRLPSSLLVVSRRLVPRPLLRHVSRSTLRGDADFLKTQ